MTTRQAAELAGVTEAAIRQGVRRGHVKRDRRGLLDPAELLAYLDRRGGAQSSP